jgi:DNA-binding NtrC family response regulator
VHQQRPHRRRTRLNFCWDCARIGAHIGAGRTVTDVVLDALETHIDALTPPAPSNTEGLFTRSTRPARQIGVQVQLRLTPANLDVLDQLVRERGFPSRSALIRAALDKHHGNHTLTARALGMPIRTLTYKIRSLGLKSSKSL